MTDYEQSIKEALNVLGAGYQENWDGGHFKKDEVCEGCMWELEEAIRILRKAVDLPIQRCLCLLCNKWCSLYKRGLEEPPEGKEWRCSECDLWLSKDQYRWTVESKGEREEGGL